MIADGTIDYVERVVNRFTRRMLAIQAIEDEHTLHIVQGLIMKHIAIEMKFSPRLLVQI